MISPLKPNFHFHITVEIYSRLAELDQVLVCSSWMEATDIQVRFTQLFPSPTTAVAAAVGVGTGGRHLVAGGHIGLLREKRNRISVTMP